MYGNLIDTIGFVAEADPEVGQAMNRELGRQRDSIELIASENIVSPAVIAAMGSVLTNKYAEGLPGKRYYGGCQWVDEVENIAIRRAKKLFGAPCRRTSQFSCLLRFIRAWRYSIGNEFSRWRPFNPWFPR